MTGLEESVLKDKLGKIEPCPCCGSDAQWSNGRERYDGHATLDTVFIKCTNCPVRTEQLTGMRFGDKGKFEYLHRIWNITARNRNKKKAPTAHAKAIICLEAANNFAPPMYEYNDVEMGIIRRVREAMRVLKAGE